MAHIISEGPIPEPTPPSLTITPSNVSGPAGSVLGPFTVTSTASTTVMATGGNMFSNAAGTVPIANGATVPSGQQICVRSTGPLTAVLQATAVATVPKGNVYLYDGNSGVNDAQRLILAETAMLTTTVSATAEFLAPGSLLVNKTIAGPAAGQHGLVVIVVTCNGTALSPPFAINAGTGTQSRTYSDIPAGSTCTVDEVVDGHTSTVTVTVQGDGQDVTIPAGGTATVNVTDTYDFVPPPGSLLVSKTITGPAAGLQGEVTIHVVRNGAALTPDFVIAANTPASIKSHEYPDIAAGSVCTVDETADGATTTVTVEVMGNNQQVTVPAGSGEAVALTDTYTDAPGSLTVTKTLAGAAAGQQGRIAMLVLCGGPIRVFAFLIPTGAAAGPVPRTYDGIPAGSTCTVLEVVDGHTSTVGVVGVGSGQRVTVPAGGTATATLTDTFAAAPIGTTTTTEAEEASQAETTTAPETLPATGPGEPIGRPIDVGVVAIVGGAVVAAGVRLSRRLDRKGRHFKR